MISDKNYYTVCGWMRNMLHLSGSDLIVFALIYSFCQGGEGVFSGSLSYIRDFTGLSRSTIIRSLEHLERLHYLKKVDKNAVNGCTNGYVVEACGCLSKDDRKVENFEGECQNDTAFVSKWNTPRVKMTPYNNINNNISTKERKKENKNTSASSRACGRAYEDMFKNMSNEELVSWGENCFFGFDTDEDVARFHAYSQECKRRTKAHWDGKIIKGDGALERLKSHEQILDENGITGPLKSKYLSFLRSSYLNGRIIPNDKLEDIIFRLNERFGRDAEGLVSKMETLDRAINGGYFDVR